MDPIALLLLLGAGGVGAFFLLRRRKDSKPTKPPPVVVPPKPKPEPIVAINIQPPSAEDQDPMLEALLALGIKHVRASWWAWSTPMSWSWCPAYQAAGIEVLPLVYPHPHVTDPDEIAASMAARYKLLHDTFGKFPYIQLGNEVDGWKEGDPPGPFSVSPGRNHFETGQLWATCMTNAALRIAQFDSATKIVTGGVAWNTEGVRDFTRGMVVVGGFDVLAIHVYGDAVFGEPLSRYLALREAGWNGPCWATEIGVSTIQSRAVGADYKTYQLENIREVFSVDASRHGWERLYWFQLPWDPEGWGITDRAWVRHPAFEWLRGFHNPQGV